MDLTQDQIDNLQKVYEQIIEIAKRVYDTIVPILKNIYEKIKEKLEYDVIISKHTRKGKRYIYTYKKIKLWKLLILNRV